ncbi:MAG: polysaccharide pyruvyl transferase family protein [Oscillospiraceae bacterium]|nr:polysaccharide pyruvyl transferase family protein [Oscillospiraceae bacterium]
MNRDTIEILNKSECTGCSACFNACPVSAIQMVPNSEGFLYPNIDTAKCIHCGKCSMSCPALECTLRPFSESECYAAVAGDKIREVSSSGGVFTALANYVLKKEGYVCGAVWEQDGSVLHKIIRSADQIDELRRTKYVQSDIGRSFAQIKEILDENKTVLFTGTPCQVAGLQKFLGSEYENLITVDIVCHGMPSAKAFRSYLQEVSGEEAITDINFNVNHHDDNSEIVIKTENGKEYRSDSYKDAWMLGNLTGLTTRLSCSACPFAQFNRIGDITLGNFKGVGRYHTEFSDDKGTGLVVLNTEKGRRLFKKISSDLKTVKRIPNVETEDIAKNNNAWLVAPKDHHPRRKRFFDLLDYMPFSKALYDAKNRHIDVSIMGWWYSENYGSALTYYALHQLILSLGLSPLMIERPVPEGEEKIVRYPNNIARRFAVKHYEISKIYHPSEMRWLNDACKTFISGSDQLFNYQLQFIAGPPFYLDFVAPYNNIVSYASSFGNDYYGDDKAVLQSAYLLKRFKALSVRESYAVDICKNKFGLDATCVLDPVFMIDRSEYDKVADQANIKVDGDYIAVFILDPDDEKRELIKHISKQMKMPVHCLIDALKIHENTQKLNLPNTHGNADVEDWLSIMRNAKFVITDSFHGTCLSIILGREFISLANYKRGAQRFESLLGQFDLMDRLVYNIGDVYHKDDLYAPINYENVYSIISKRREESLDWLKHAIFDPMKADATNNQFQVVDYQLTDLKFELLKMKRKTEEDINELKRQINALKG